MRGADYVWSERTQSDIMREMLKGHTVTVQRQITKCLASNGAHKGLAGGLCGLAKVGIAQEIRTGAGQLRARQYRIGDKRHILLVPVLSLGSGWD
jgi:hypothetical protein